VNNYIVTTHHAVALWRNHPSLVARVAAAAQTQEAKLHLCQPVVGEMWYRIYNMPDREVSERLLEEFLTKFPMVEYDAAAAKEFGLIKNAMTKIRRPISDVDAQVSSIARTREMTVLSADQHFSAIPRLKVENWLL
jgi:predicted nucleic acid-binding protein